jgi:hypothetical protein
LPQDEGKDYTFPVFRDRRGGVDLKGHVNPDPVTLASGRERAR